MDSPDGFKIVKGEGYIKGDINQASRVLQSPDFQKAYDNMLDKVDEFELLPLQSSYVYNSFKGEWGVSGRDIVMLGTFYMDDQDRRIIVTTSASHPTYMPNPKLVRANLHIGGWILSPDKFDSS